MAAGDSKEEFKQAYLDMGYDESDFEAVWANMQTMGEGFDALANSAFAVAEAERARAEVTAQSIAQNNKIISESEDFG